MALFDDAGRPPLSSYVSYSNQQKLIHWNAVERIDKYHVLTVLQSKHLPKPETWRQLLRLWAYVATDLTGYRYGVSRTSVRIVPAQGKNVLYSASEVVRIGEKRLLQFESDWEFLAAHLLVLNQNWPRFLAEQRRNADEQNNKDLKEEVESAAAVFRAIEMEGTSDVNEVIEQVATEFFTQKSIPIAKCIQLTQIAAKLGATIGRAFWFVTRNHHLIKGTSGILFDRDGTLDAFFGEDWCNAHVLHPDYTSNFASCSAEEWRTWVSSGRASLLGFAPLASQQIDVYGRKKIEAEIQRRGGLTAPSYPFVTHQFRLEDWDFDSDHWTHWERIAEEDPSIWGHIVDRILDESESSWTKAKSARVVQVATTGNTRSITSDLLLAMWILKLRELPCLRDTRGFYKKPGDLLRRTPETESLMDVEPFIHGHLDNEATRPLLNLLGVRDVPTGPDRLLDCLRALAKAPNVPAHEVEKWYRRLDQMIDTCSSADFVAIKTAFHDEKILLSEDAGWSNAAGVVLSAGEEMPGTAVVRAAVRELTLWRKVGVAERPTADLAIEWLQGLPSGDVLSPDDARRVRALLVRHPLRIWDECQHWTSLSGEWVSVDTVAYSLSMQSLVPWKNLYEQVKQKTADLQGLPVEVSSAPPFSDLPHLADRIEERFQSMPHRPSRIESRVWLNQLGYELQRIELDDEGEQCRIRGLATDLASTSWQITPGLEIIPYIDGTPAGIPRRAEAVWLNGILHVEDRPLARLARAVAQELGRVFRRQDVTDAIKLCFDRPQEFVTEYLEENFKLGPRVAIVVPVCPLDSATIELDASTGDASPAVDQVRTSVDDSQDIDDDLTRSDDPPEHDNEDQSRDPTPPDDPRPKHNLEPKPPTPSIIERFARAQGFKKDGVERFFHADGSWIAKTHDVRFPWERRTAHGELLSYYWPKDHCLERDPLQLEADIWGLLDQSPDHYALVLADPEGEPVEISGARLRSMRDVGEVTLYPAAYRLVLDHDRKK